MRNSDFSKERTGTGTREWAEKSENIQRGCAHACLYCYAAGNAHRFKLRARSDWPVEELTSKAEVTSYPRREGVIMFPTAHDITPFNIDAYVRVVKLMLAAGNRVLIVSKPHLGCITRLVAELDAYKDQVLFRFTIGTMDAVTAAFWEPGAPAPAERLAALELAFRHGYQTSVSAEPLLGGMETAVAIFDATSSYVTDKIWFGKLNRGRQRVPGTQENLAAVHRIELAQTDEALRELYRRFGSERLVAWKDSIKAVVGV